MNKQIAINFMFYVFKLNYTKQTLNNKKILLKP